MTEQHSFDTYARSRDDAETLLRLVDALVDSDGPADQVTVAVNRARAALVKLDGELGWVARWHGGA